MPHIGFFLSRMTELNNKKVRRIQYSPGHRLYPPNEITEMELIELFTYAEIVKNHFDEMFKYKKAKFIERAEKDGVKKWDWGHALLYITKRKCHSFDHDPYYQELLDAKKALENKIEKHLQFMRKLSEDNLSSKEIELADGRTIEVQAAKPIVIKGLYADHCMETLFWKLRMFE